jgi:hypothetical protein
MRDKECQIFKIYPIPFYKGEMLLSSPTEVVDIIYHYISSYLNFKHKNGKGNKERLWHLSV